MMIYLQTYEYWKDGEKSVKKIELKDLQSMIEKHCKDFSWVDHPIYRGMYNNDVLNLNDAMLFKPRLSKRMSENTQNYYTWIIDNSPAYKEYPDRSKSLICTDDRVTSEYFGNEECWRVIPFDGAKIGVCSSLDLWGSYDNGLKPLSNKYYQLDDFNSKIEIYYEALFSETNFGQPKSAKEFFINLKKMLDKMEDFEKNDYEIMKQNYKYPDWVDIDFAMNLPKTVKGVMDLFDPKLNGFKLMDYKDYAKNAPIDREVWIGADCILVHVVIAEELEERLRKGGKYIYKDIEKIR